MTNDAIEKFVHDWLRGVDTVVGPIQPDLTLVDLGLDSLDIVELSRSVRKELGIQVLPKDIESYATLTETIEVIRDRASG